MLELGQGPDAGAADLIKDGSEATFMEDVIEASKTVPVIVDFWAPWCGPCKTLGPALEQAVTAAGGKVRMVKLDVDQNQGIAGQLRIQSIPTVYGFVNGQPVDGFQGAQTPSAIKDFIDKLIAQSPAGDGGLDEALDMADQMVEEGALADAAQTYAAVLGEDKENIRAIAGFAKAHVAMGDLERARAILDMTPEGKAEDPAIAAVRATIELTEASADAGETSELRDKIAANPDDHQSRLDLAMALVGSGDTEGAIDALLESFGRDREWNEGAAKEQLFKLFDSLGAKDPIAQKGRRRLSSMIFA